MRPHPIFAACAAGIALIVTGCASAPENPPTEASRAEAPAPARIFSYDDLDRYARAVAAVQGGADPAASFQAYLDGASEGMRTYLDIYPTTAAQIAEEYAQRPAYYAALAGMRARIAPLEPEIARAYGRLEALHPGASLGSVTFLVSDRSAGGTAREIGTLVAVELFGRTPETDLAELGEARFYDENELAQVVVHEGVHNLQRQIQGQQNFISIYVNPERMTLRNFAIREGAADYVTHHLTGRRFAPRHDFADSREAAIWAEFQPIMQETIFTQPGWFQGRFADGRDWPIQVGYFVGYKMAEHIHRNGADPDAALIEILSPYTDEQFQAIADRYAAKFIR